jgi:hypothetical protein
MLLATVLSFIILNAPVVSAVSKSFTDVGQHSWTVPSGVYAVTASVISGIELIVNFAVRPGDVYYFIVGGDGNEDGTGGYNGGGAGNDGGSGGGGATDIRTTPDITSRIVVAGGNGGGYCLDSYGGTCYNGGGAGCAGLSGYDGDANPQQANSTGGLGGTQSAGGAGGFFNDASYTGDSGNLETGGDAAINAFGPGGGGGAGYYGGGGGSGTAGGGGSSYSIFPSTCYPPSKKHGVYLSWAVEYTLVYEYNGKVQTFDKPSDVTWVVVNVTGAQGGSSAMGEGGLGTFLSVNASLELPYVFTGEYGYYVNVGGQDSYNGGGLAGCADAGVGGGASDFSLFISSSDPPQETTVVYAYAAGGGGAGSAVFCPETVCDASSIQGGGGGLVVGITGSNNPFDLSSTGGAGGSQSAGGVGGHYNASYPSGRLGIFQHGGNGAADTCGGGSSFSQVTILEQRPSAHQGNGQITITFWSATYSPPDHHKHSGSLAVGTIAAIAAGAVVGLCCCGVWGSQAASGPPRPHRPTTTATTTPTSAATTVRRPRSSPQTSPPPPPSPPPPHHPPAQEFTANPREVFNHLWSSQV